MRFRILKKNVLAVLAFSLIVLILMFRKRLFMNLDNDTDRVADVLHENTQSAVMAKFQYGSVLDMTKSVFDGNYRQFIQNADRFPEEPQLVVVVQVHNRPAYLKMLIQSLEKATEVQSFLLIFSHDYFSEEIADLVQGITFCKVLQIYFPYSRQLYPSEFPGQDPLDCPRDISKENAIKTGCLNAEHPDSYGHYREAAITQTKHHWWWKLHFVWERVQALQGYRDFAIFIEEDNYVLPDFYHIFKRMSELRKNECPDCDMLALGNHDSLEEFHRLTNKMETTGWLSTKHNIGMGISREVYYKLMGCSDDFCTYDDYNWDWTLQHLSGKCIAKPLKVLVAQGSRVLHTGNCGMHQKDLCDPALALQKVTDFLEQAKNSLFPKSLVLAERGAVVRREHMKNGGWGDVRDHVLCKNYAKLL